MAEVLEDGHGTGEKLKIRNGRLFSRSLSESSEEAAAADGDSFIVAARCETAAIAKGVFMSIKNNNAESSFLVTRIYIYPQTLADADVLCSQMFNAEASGGSVVDTVIQKNQIRKNTFDLEVSITDAAETATYTGGTEYHCVPLSSRRTDSRNMNATNVIGPGDSLVFGFERESGLALTAGQVVAFSVNIIKKDL